MSVIKIYTRGGDKGQTHLLGGERIHKHSQRVISYGMIDEVNSFIGLAIAEINNEMAILADLHQLQNLLFDCGADLATPEKAMKKSRIKQLHIDWLEEKIDQYIALLSPIRHFILPGGSKAAAQLHVARTVTRRAEREIIAVLDHETIYPTVLPFVNRLSDYLFVLARYMNQVDGVKEHQYVVSSAENE